MWDLATRRRCGRQSASRLGQLRRLQPGWQYPSSPARGWRGAALGRQNRNASHGSAPASSVDLVPGLQPRRYDRAHRRAFSDNVRLWDTATGMPLGPIHPTSQSRSYRRLQPRRQDFLTGCDDQAVRLFRNVSELPDDLDRIATWVEVLTGLTLDAEHGTIQVLDNAAWRERRQQLEQAGWSAGDSGRTEARSDSARYRSDGPRSCLDRAGAVGRGRGRIRRGRPARPYNASSWIARAGFRIARGQPERAAADFAVAIRLTPEDLRTSLLSGLVAAWPKATRPAWRQVCSDLLRSIRRRARSPDVQFDRLVSAYWDRIRLPTARRRSAWPSSVVKHVAGECESPPT